MSIVITIIVGALLSYIIYKVATVPRFRVLYRNIFKKFQLRLIPYSMMALTGVFTVGYLLTKSNPIFSLSWLNLLGKNGGNLLITSNTGSSSGSGGGSFHMGLGALLLTIAVPTLLLLAIPFLAWSEEMDYRKNSEKRTLLQKITMALKFGLIHMIVGVPLGFGLALAIGGGYFTHRYMREYRRTNNVNQSILASTIAHTVYNYMALGIFFTAVGLAYSYS